MSLDKSELDVEIIIFWCMYSVLTLSHAYKEVLQSEALL